MGYGLFLFAQLMRDTTTVYKDMEYDVMWDDVRKRYSDFKNSKYDDDNKGLYECIVNYINKKVN
jgi:hypothetical protein